jgi:hypothetical protein
VFAYAITILSTSIILFSESKGQHWPPCTYP